MPLELRLAGFCIVLISLIVTTYDREDALAAVLRSLASQTDRNFEVIVADDGSGPATKAVIESWRGKLGVPLIHIWQEHRGFRAAEIRNRAVAASKGEYCIFLDGDCLVRSDFVAMHRRLAERGRFLTGNRALLSEQLTAKILQERVAAEAWTLGTWLSERMRGGLNRIGPLLRVPLGPLRKLRGRTWRDARSCNLAVWRSDLRRVDGFDAAYVGWGREDSDLLVRLIRSGVRRKDGVFATGVLHLWHPEADRSQLAENQRRLDQVSASGRVRAVRGLSTIMTAEKAPMLGQGNMENDGVPR
jgi:glycosyltransferase involved in cell wall biosynthesis